MARYQRSTAGQLSQRAVDTAILRGFLEGYGADRWIQGLLHIPELREAWDISDEQYQAIRNATQIAIYAGQEDPRYINNPELREFRLELEAELRLLQQNDYYLDNASEKMQKRFQVIHEQRVMMDENWSVEQWVPLLTPEQRQMIQEFQIATISEMPMIAPSMLEALDLTEAQKQQIEGIKNTLAPEFEKTLEEHANRRKTILDKVIDVYERHEASIFRQESQTPEKMEAIKNTLMADREFLRLHEEIATDAENFATRFKVQLFDVLADEQWNRFQNLVDNPPEYIKAWLSSVYSSRNRQREAQQQEVWQPGPESWRPGDAIPEAYRQERNMRGNFPRPAN
jgi:hypothetical protein